MGSKKTQPQPPVRSGRPQDRGYVPKGTKPEQVVEKGKELEEDMDALVDQIDAVLEENAAVFVDNYVQRGGE
jgi:prokaryotic ubiquitin-like protein Pup